MEIIDHKIGEQFGYLTILAQSQIRYQRVVQWYCRCSCGKEVLMQGTKLRSGDRLSCGCHYKNRYALKQGQKFGELTVLSKANTGENGKLQWNCECVCGAIVVVSGSAMRTGRRISCGCRRVHRRIAEDSPQWKGGRNNAHSGYIRILNREYANTGKRYYVYEHTLIMSRHIGRPLVEGETVHHKNGIRNDNRIENLELWTKNHPAGQRIADLAAFAREILTRYEPDGF